jgi:hypothetical protein
MKGMLNAWSNGNSPSNRGRGSKPLAISFLLSQINYTLFLEGNMDRDETIELFINELKKKMDLGLWQEAQIRLILGDSHYDHKHLLINIPKNHGRSIFSRRDR